MRPLIAFLVLYDAWHMIHCSCCLLTFFSAVWDLTLTQSDRLWSLAPVFAHCSTRAFSWQSFVSSILLPLYHSAQEVRAYGVHAGFLASVLKVSFITAAALWGPPLPSPRPARMHAPAPASMRICRNHFNAFLRIVVDEFVHIIPV